MAILKLDEIISPVELQFNQRLPAKIGMMRAVTSLN
jgi:hypothetical protein